MAAPVDLLLHGATGFTGRRAAARLVEVLPAGLSLALAGRSEERLRALAQRLGGVPWRVCDATRPAEVEAAVAGARVVLNCAGPFSKYGDAVVAACVRHGAHYVDITGETTWARLMIDAHDAGARAAGTAIVPFCGFDSVPADLGCAALAAEAARRGTELEEVLGVYRIAGGLNGGTLATVLHLAEQASDSDLADPYLLVPAAQPDDQQRAHQADPSGPAREPGTGRWCPPFFMGPINRRVVLRSARLAGERGSVGSPLAYAPEFLYAEHHSAGGGGRLRAGATTLLGRLAGMALATRPGRTLARRLGPSPGEGPSEDTIANGYSRLDLYGELSDGARLHRRIEVDGDPGNRVTVLCLTEAALSLALEGAQLDLGRPGAGGVLTPVLAFGELLGRRLSATGEWRAGFV